MIMKSIIILFCVLCIFSTPLIADCSDNWKSKIKFTEIRPEGSWVSCKENQWLENEPLRSELNGKQNSSISIKNIDGAGYRCLSFKWKISEGNNQIALYDNGKPTFYKLPNSIPLFSEHPYVDWTNVTYILNDDLEHELQWVHINPYGVGTAWIEEVNISEPLVIFREPKVIPKRGKASDKFDPVVFNGTKWFNYSVEIETNLSPLEIELFIISPNTENKSAISQGKRELNGKWVEWNNIELECDNYGNGKYWFLAKSYNGIPIRSNLYLGPNISVFVTELSTDAYNFTDIGQNISGELTLIGNSKKNIYFEIQDNLGNFSPIGKTGKYTNNGKQTIRWDEWLPISLCPIGARFNII